MWQIQKIFISIVIEKLIVEALDTLTQIC